MIILWSAAMKKNPAHARKRLDERLALVKRQGDLQPPPKGWVRAIRDALGMSGAQLGKRIGVSAQTVDALEKSETAGTLQLKNLRRLAEAMDCTLVYALVPNRPLTQMVDERAREIALHDISRVTHTMRLEAQETGGEGIEDRIDNYMRENVSARDLWNAL
jgi:predicted DNA-binding mobile mystery protein A